MAIRGIGGVFFKARDPEKVAAWYEHHLGVRRDTEGYTVMGWREVDRPHELGETVWAPFPEDTEYFAPGDAPWMLNYRVDDLDAELARLAAEGVTLVGEPQTFDYGKFGWGLDCEGHKFELWEPPANPPFPVTVPEVHDVDLGPAWLCDPGKSLASGGATMDDQVVVVERRVDIERDEVWRLWTTGDGLAEWLVENSRVDLRIGGPYELYFNPDEDPGLRGGEGNKVLTFLPPRILSFTWNAPPKFAYTRDRHTHVVLELDEIGSSTLVRLTHLGWPSADSDPHAEWAQTFAYFESAWEHVFAALDAHAKNRK